MALNQIKRQIQTISSIGYPKSIKYRLGGRRISTKNLILDSVLEAGFYAQHRPLIFKQSNAKKFEQKREDYADEYAKLFNGFVPFMPPGPRTRIADSIVEDSQNAEEENSLENVLLAMEIHSVLQPSSQPRSDERRYEMISILKRRRKKMNKHKWKKHRRAVRNSSRYNKEKLRKPAKMRKRQE